ncbi:hypothetical protein K432DRAFT_128322, partial [Lepidopterella palustris CBS 459.81]
MAGHLSQPGCFEIRRASVTPPDVLLSLIWPELDIWKDRFGPGVDQINDLAAIGAINLLFYLREVLLQDSVVLRQLFPSSAVWTTLSFNTRPTGHLPSRWPPTCTKARPRVSYRFSIKLCLCSWTSSRPW